MTGSSKDLADRLGRLFAERAPAAVVSTYLFGSHADDRSHQESDVDVGILLSWEKCPTARDRFQERVDTSSWLGAELGGGTVDVVVLNDAPAGFASKIVTRGRRVFCADAEADHAFVRDVQLRAADLEPFLRRTRQIKLDSLAR